MSGFKVLCPLYGPLSSCHDIKHTNMTTLNFNLDISLSICLSSWNICPPEFLSVLIAINFHYLLLLNASPVIWLSAIASEIQSATNRYSANVDHDMLTSYSLMSIALQCILTQPNEQVCFWPPIFSQCHYALRHRTLRSRPSVDWAVRQHVPTT